jgi:hypothetical protein
MAYTTKIYEGLLCLHNYGEASNVLFLSSLSDPIAEELYWIHNKKVTARYWISDKPCTREEVIDATILTVMGIVKVDFGSHYGEDSDYLWTDEELKIGRHDLLSELKSHVGKWLILDLEVH